ncbi:MAG: 16S rRNA (cytidine(1402)-2'-O)-methyltransferase [Anaerolineales bacterium]|nr:MAG: 16S rRNA (cytidine(1402)-2'-O)-methyltransferase [Anaerolineales bacterium]
MGTLYLVATPIGNLEDITLRALRVLRECELVATEDTRTTGRLLAHFNIEKPLISHHAHSKPAQLKQILATLEAGDVALVSDAGTPLLSDPGYELVQAAVERGAPVISIPGPSALTAALPLSALPTDRFMYLGFLPRPAADRRRALAEVASVQATLVFFEAPHRLRAALADAVDSLGGQRRCAVCRELTKLHEEVWRGTLADALFEWRERQPRGEFTIVVEGAPAPAPWDEDRVRSALADLLTKGISRSEAARRVARQSGWAKSDVYAAWPRGAG